MIKLTRLNNANMRYDYFGPYIHGIAEYRIGGEVGYINKKGVIVKKNS